ncbi:MAG: hypothetical protein JEY91_19840 [Spirochaetaceae bacterium]|nr:hypothetical protein [Spirochaetaceae bacterium]MBL7007338.1 hypothetical protein [Spirochaetia bacterium]
MDQETKEFLASLEKENGGKILFKTYAVLIGFSNGQNINLGGLLYIINHTLYFEDFEKQGGLFGLITAKKKRAYKKYKTSIDISSIKNVYSVKMSAAKAVVTGKLAQEQLFPVAGFKKKLFQTSIFLSCSEEPGWFLEVIDDKKFIQTIEERK